MQRGLMQGASGYWIQHYLAQRGEAYLLVRDALSQIVRTLDWAFRVSHDKPAPLICVGDFCALAPGRCRNRITGDPGLTTADRRPPILVGTDGVSGDMNGTAQYWDLHDDDVTAPGTEQTRETYTIQT